MSKWIKRFKYEQGDIYEANYQARIWIGVSIVFPVGCKGQLQRQLLPDAVCVFALFDEPDRCRIEADPGMIRWVLADGQDKKELYI